MSYTNSLISAFVVRCLDSVMSLVSVTKISSLMLATVAEQASLSLTWSETPEDMVSHDEAHMLPLKFTVITTDKLAQGWQSILFQKEVASDTVPCLRG